MGESTTLGALAASGRLVLSDGYRTKQPELAMPGAPILRVAEVLDGRIAPGFGDHVSDEYRQRFAAKTSRPGDVVVTTKGTVGRVARIGVTDPEFVYAPQLCFFRTADAEIDSRFLYYWFRSGEFRQQAAAVKAQTDMADYVNLADIRGLRITLPSGPEQRAIAEVLGALDDKIEANRRQVETADSIADVRFSQCLAEMDTQRVADLATEGALALSDGYRTRADQLGVPGAPILRVADMQSGHFDAPTGDRVSERLRDRYASKCSRPGDVVVTAKGTVGRVALVGASDPEVVYSPQLCFFRVLDASRLSPTIVHRWARSDGFRARAETVQGQTDMAAYVNLRDLGDFQLPLVDPSDPVVTEIDEIDALVEQRRRETLDLTMLRDALLPELLSGRPRVPDAERVAEAVT